MARRPHSEPCSAHVLGATVQFMARLALLGTYVRGTLRADLQMCADEESVVKSSDIQRIRRIASQVRADLAAAYDCEVTPHGRLCLGGFCWNVSETIADRIQGAKILVRVRIIDGEFCSSLRDRTWEDHCYLRVNGLILDATATQFGDFPAVWFPANERRYR